MADELVFEGKDFDELAVRLRVAADVYRVEMTPTMLEIGEVVKEAAKVVAGRHSRSIPDTIKAEPLPGAVAVRAGDPAVPIAQLFELGNRGSRRSAETFKHPVYGHDVWVEQAKHPYLRPALIASRREITRRLEKAWDRVLRMIEER